MLPMMRDGAAVGNGAARERNGTRTRTVANDTLPPSPWRMVSSNGTSIVVGASSGMGLAIARRLAIRGRKVAMLARREAELRAMVATTNESLGRTAAFAYVHDAGVAGCELRSPRAEERLDLGAVVHASRVGALSSGLGGLRVHVPTATPCARRMSVGWSRADERSER